MKKITYILLLATILIAACEEQPVVIPMGGGPVDPIPGDSVVRVVLMEELTGVSCPPCYDGATIVDKIIEKFGGRVVVNAIHGAALAQPTPESKYDFRYEDAAQLETSFFFYGKPAGIIDRNVFDDIGALAVDKGDWEVKVSDRLSVKPLLDLSATSEYNSSTRVAKINIEAKALEDIDGIVKIHVVVNESKLIDPQLSIVFDIVLDFEHKHVMKDMLTTVQGDFFIEGMALGEKLDRDFSYTVPAELNGEWIPENMEVVYYFTSTDEDGEVLQAGAIHLTE